MMHFIEKLCRDSEIVRKDENFNGVTTYRCTQAQLAMLVHLARQGMRDQIVDKLGDYSALKCAQIAASIEA